MLPIVEVQIESLQMSDIGLGKTIYTYKQLDEFTAFQDSQGTRRAYLVKTARLAHNDGKEHGEWGVTLGSQAQASKIDLLGLSFIFMYKVVSPLLFFMSLLLMMWLGFQLVVTVCLQIAIITRY